MDRSRPETDDRTEFENYLPGMPALSEEPGRVERLFDRLFGSRDDVHVRIRKKRQ